jgi:hypothetical protein
MDRYRLSIFAAAFIGAISASMVTLAFQPADPAVGARAAVAPARSAVALPAPVRSPAPGMNMDDGPADSCEIAELCDTIDDNDPIEI